MKGGVPGEALHPTTAVILAKARTTPREQTSAKSTLDERHLDHQISGLVAASLDELAASEHQPSTRRRRFKAATTGESSYDPA
ncbi:hypothetical protein [Bradyrhizobium liaoningense]|uniref:hypothetical protein n=1 Tax=Bradyrhizobium liaoningense TaxID=43992 RepID=UPI001BAB37B9|nr:hypothetical protein [Bradyrhizobium liaoningense]MBR0907515.1 hypothetical protein [Bradyrhizobium liaoningense]